jgi:hypothetical protein
MSTYNPTHQLRYEQTAKGRAARARAQTNWNAKRNAARAAARQARRPPNVAPLVEVLAAWK